jgi:hypothetical protein
MYPGLQELEVAREDPCRRRRWRGIARKGRVQENMPNASSFQACLPRWRDSD